MSVPFTARPARGSAVRRRESVAASPAPAPASRGGSAELRDLAMLGGKVDALQREVAALRQENEELKALVTGFTTLIEQAFQPLRATQEVLLVAAEVIEQQRVQALDQREELQQLITSQREAQDRLADAFRLEHEHLRQHLDAIAESDDRVLAGVESRSHELVRTLDERRGAVRAELARLGDRIQQGALRDREAATRFGEAGAQAARLQEEMSRQLLGLGGTLQDINQTLRATAATESAQLTRENLEAAMALNRAGLQQLARGTPEAAARHFEEARARAPQAFEPAFNLAIVSLHARRPHEALRRAGELAAAFPDRPEPAWLCGVARLASGDPSGAAAALTPLARLESSPAPLHAAAGLASLLAGDSRAALASFHQLAGGATPEATLLGTAGLLPGSTLPAS